MKNSKASRDIETLKLCYKLGDSSNYHKRMVKFEEDYRSNPSIQDYLKAIKE